MSVLLQDRHGAVAVLTLNRPERRNALGADLRDALMAAVDAIEGDASIRSVVITGAGGNFCAGGDVSAMKQPDIASGRDRFRISHRVVRAIIASSKPYFAAVEGWAVGAGLGLAVACDTVVAADNARFMAGFARIGLIPDWGLFHTLPRRIGDGRAKQMFIHNEPVSAEAAERFGLADQIVPAGQALASAVARAEALSAIAPQSIAMTKSFFTRDLGDALEWERNAQALLALSADHAEGRAAFLEKRKPVFKGA